ncbi:Fis family transcriptional regulator [Marinomonas ostreistagni]|uniref:Fis family transcriptional regulator n=1 Tax=Marinomonas ostreistagni TaxID=359209 RepID=A0ABS0Z7K4_9GAMM|nr:Fis family transcriptional regulator [Marinomonas ostreistagni]MBJ7549647.1 Fis family transcriptional regulator [Marinomonas ostreistagni]
MRKTDKKRDNLIRQTLTEVCDGLLKQNLGFAWLTHTVDYNAFPQSLKVIVIFETDEAQELFANSSGFGNLISDIANRFKQLDIRLSTPKTHVFLDNEEACFRNHEGKWANRLQQH